MLRVSTGWTDQRIKPESTEEVRAERLTAQKGMPDAKPLALVTDHTAAKQFSPVLPQAWGEVFQNLRAGPDASPKLNKEDR